MQPFGFAADFVVCVSLKNEVGAYTSLLLHFTHAIQTSIHILL